MNDDELKQYLKVCHIRNMIQHMLDHIIYIFIF